METQKALQQRNKPEQLRLWPAEDDDALIYQASSQYRQLDDTGQRIVRAYLVELDRCGDWPTQSRVAVVAGVSRSTVSAHLSDKSSAAWQAITDVLVASRDDLARRSTVAIPALATLIMRQFLPGEGRLPRATNTLTRVEYDVLRLASAMGGCAVAADGGPASLQVNMAQQAPDGTKTATQVSISAGPTLSEMLSKLRGDAPEPTSPPVEPAEPKVVQLDGQSADRRLEPSSEPKISASPKTEDDDKSAGGQAVFRTADENFGDVADLNKSSASSDFDSEKSKCG